MINFRKIQDSLLFLEGDWREKAKCVDANVEMVPGGDAEDKIRGPEVLLAKQVCTSCPVIKQCSAAAGQQAGVWGCLTRNERERLLLGEATRTPDADKAYVVRCQQCDLDCVPATRDHQMCDTCLPEGLRPSSPQEHKEEILKLLQTGRTYVQIGLKLGIDVKQLGTAIRSWRANDRTHGNVIGGRWDPHMLAPCGTPAARRRHQRRNESMLRCACSQPGASNPRRTKKNGWTA